MKQIGVAILICLAVLTIFESKGQLKSRLESEVEKADLEYIRRRNRGIVSMNQATIEKLQAIVTQAKTTGDLGTVSTAQAEIDKLDAEISTIGKAAPIFEGQIPSEVVVEVLIDGLSELTVTKDGLLWISRGASKPGRHHGRDEPTYVNGEKWDPRWEEPRKNSGGDESAAYRLATVPELLKFELLAVTIARGESGVEQRSPIQTAYQDGRFIVSIPDSENDSRWYRFRLYYFD